MTSPPNSRLSEPLLPVPLLFSEVVRLCKSQSSKARSHPRPILWLPRLASDPVECWLLFWLVCPDDLSSSHRLVTHAAAKKPATQPLPPVAGLSLGSNGAGRLLAG
jgi:hypothetical protein